MMPHHHLVIGPVEGEVACYDGEHFDIRRYRKRFDYCACLSHSFARPWFEVTGDSYIVHAIAAHGERNIGSYMGKYLTKTFGMEGRLNTLGVSRRWSNSKGWPGGGRMRLATKDWDMIMALPGHKTVRENASDPVLLEREGEDVTRALSEKRHHRRNIEYIRRKTYVKDDSPQGFADTGGSRNR